VESMMLSISAFEFVLRMELEPMISRVFVIDFAID
jgi:hypothetical protein